MSVSPVTNQIATTAFQTTSTYSVGSTMYYEDGLSVSLNEINDSRCKPGVVCIWAGELSPVFVVKGGSLGAESKEVRLGTERSKQMTVGAYTFSLGETTETKADLRVTK